MEPKRFEFSDGSSNKFWQIARDGAALLVTFGKIGTEDATKLLDVLGRLLGSDRLDGEA